MMTIIKKIQNWYKSLRLFVIVDPTDNSVTFSKKLFIHIRKNSDATDKATVFVFRVSDTGLFGFMLNPNIDKPTNISVLALKRLILLSGVFFMIMDCRPNIVVNCQFLYIKQMGKRSTK